MTDKRFLTVFLAALALTIALVLAPSAGAAVSGTATLAPIGTGNYLLTVQNTGDQEVRTLSASGSGEGFTNFDPSGCIALGGGFGCVVSIAPAASMQICYSGPAVMGVTLEVNLAHVPVTSAPAVASCPLPGFTPVSTVTPPGPTPGGGGPANGGAGGGAFSLGKVKDHVKTGTATLAATVPGPGTLALSDKGVKATTVHPKSTGATALTVKATGKAAGKLARTGKAKVTVSVTFTPTGGAPTTQTKSVKLVKQLGK
jgi:hypothetical protein